MTGGDAVSGNASTILALTIIRHKIQAVQLVSSQLSNQARLESESDVVQPGWWSVGQPVDKHVLNY
jgi:hypothetical protein